MKLVFLLGDAAVGKMTVGQELAKITELRLFHNHMAIEPVLQIFGYFDAKAIMEIRDAVFRNFAASGQYGMIFTMLMAFDMPEDWAYLQHIRDIFAPYGTEFYYVELVAPQHIRLERNGTENRLAHKPSKRDLEASNRRLLADDTAHRCVSHEGEIPFANYLRIDNSRLSAAETAAQIRQHFGL